MKKLSVITGILVFVAVLLAALGAVCGAVDQMAADENFYSGMSRAAVTKYLKAENDPQADAAVTEYIGLAAEEQAAFAGEMAAFMRGETDAQPDILNEKEQQHMRDVRTLTGNAGSMSKTYLYIAAALAVAAAWTAAKLDKRRYMPKLIGLLAAVSIVMLLVNSVTGDIGALGFEVMYTKMHEALFQNDLWLMNPETDILIRMMPQLLFERAAMDVVKKGTAAFAVTGAMLAVVYAVFGGMIRRHLTERK